MVPEAQFHPLRTAPRFKSQLQQTFSEDQMSEQQTPNGEAKAAAAEKTVETIEMKDGRKVEFPGKRQLLKESFEDGGKVAVRLDFRNGETRTFVLPDTLLYKFAAHGAEQKLGDETAGLKDLDDAVMAVDKLIERLNTGEWNMAREAGGMAGTSVLARALAEIKNLPIERVKEFLSKKSQAEKIALRNNPSVKPVVERIEAEKNAKASKVDTEALLGELA
jgi:G:T/U-mismatch repair DNA glycosylase